MIFPPEPKVHKKYAPSPEQIVCTDAISQLWQWTRDPANARHPLKASVEALLQQCQRLADQTARFEELRIEVLTLRSHNAQWQKKFAAQVNAEGVDT